MTSFIENPPGVTLIQLPARPKFSSQAGLATLANTVLPTVIPYDN